MDGAILKISKNEMSESRVPNYTTGECSVYFFRGPWKKIGRSKLKD